jgi:uncharacterized peroxidase-related enzyme
MAMIQTISPEQASGKVAHIYGQIEQVMGRVPNAMQIYSSSPDLLEQQWQQIGYYMQHPTLSFPLLALIRMLVSQENQCEYCVGFNEGMLINVAGFTPDQVAAAKRNPDDAPISEKEMVMLQFVLNATKYAKNVKSGDLDALRNAGWNDGEIMDALHHGARNIAVDVVFNALKIDKDF